MLCERYKIRETAIKCTRIINSVKTERNLCSYCAREVDFGQYSALLDGGPPLGKLLSGLLGLGNDEEENGVRESVVCPTCGTSFGDFMENNWSGCVDCYGVSDLLINDKMKQLQGSKSHKSKHPKYRSTFEKEYPGAAGGPGEEPQENTDCLIEAGPQDSQTAAVKKRIKELDAELKETVRQEDYELVASYRDQIRELKKEAGTRE